MKIALLSEKYTPDIGGLAISAERLARLLTSAGHNIRVFAPTPNLLPSEKRTLLSSGVHVTRFGAHKRMDDTLVDWFELILEEHKLEPFDILHAYFLTQAGFVSTYAGKYLDVPSVVSIRGNDIERAAFDPSRFSHTMYALQNANAVTTNATELAKKARAFIDREIILIPNGIDIEHFKPMERNIGLAEVLGLKNVILPKGHRDDVSAATLAPGAHLPRTQVPRSVGEDLYHDMSETLRSQKPLPQSDIVPVIGFVGELREKKGLKTLLNAYALVNKKLPVTLVIVGEVRQGEDKQAFDEFREELRVSHPDSRIIVTGYISHNDLPAYYSLIDVFVHPSLRDGMPNAVLEAMACEKAVVATLVGGVADLIKDGENGSIVPVNDAESLSNAIINLLNDESLRGRLGKSAREIIQQEFTLQRELDLNLKVYKSLGAKG